MDYYSDDPTGRKAGEDAFDMRKPLTRVVFLPATVTKATLVNDTGIGQEPDTHQEKWQEF